MSTKAELENLVAENAVALSDLNGELLGLEQSLGESGKLIKGLRSERAAMRKSFTQKLKEAISIADGKRQEKVAAATENYDILVARLVFTRNKAKVDLASGVLGVPGQFSAQRTIDLIDELLRDIE